MQQSSRPRANPERAPSPATTHLRNEQASMSYFPLFHDLKGKKVLLIGSGPAADAKAKLLERAGAELIYLIDQLPTNDDLVGTALMVIAVEDEATAQSLAAQGRAAGILVNAVDRTELCDVIFPAIVDRGPVTIAIGTGGMAPALARNIRARIERAVPAGYGRLASLCGSLRAEVKRRLPSLDARKHFWDRVIGGSPAALMLAGQEQAARGEIDRLLAGEAPQPMVHLVGAGPGDPDLLTLKAARLIGEADVILHDQLCGTAVLDLARRDARLIDVGKRCGRRSISQDEINELLLEEARKGIKVVRLKTGDPFIFGRGGEELAFLQAQGVAVEVVPGITAALAAGSRLQAPLTHRGVSRSLHLVTGHLMEGDGPDWSDLAKLQGTVAVYMGRGAAGRIAAQLIAGGLSPATPAIAVENASLPGERACHSTLAELPFALAESGFDGPTLLLVGAALTAALPQVCETV